MKEGSRRVAKKSHGRDLGDVLIDERGSITAEYAVLLCLVALGCSVAVAGLGAQLVRMHIAQEAWLLLAVL